MATPRDFRRDLERFGQKVEAVLTEVYTEVALETRLQVAIRTPKKTGRAAGSWNLSAGSPDYRIKPATYNNPEGCIYDGNISTTGFRLGLSYYISNAIAYLPILNHGSSQQAPAGFIEATAQAVSAFVPQKVLYARRKIRV